MSDETTQTDAEVIAEYREMVDYYASVGQPGCYVITGHHLRQAAHFDAAALRTIDALAAERDAARAELARLREAVKKQLRTIDVIANTLQGDMLLVTDNKTNTSRWTSRKEILADASVAIRAALGEDGTP